VTWALASLALALTAPWVFWPLIRHRAAPVELQPSAAPSPALELEEIEYEQALGHISAREAAERKQDLR